MLPLETKAAAEKFYFEIFKDYGIPVLAEPCKLLDVMEEVLIEVIPFYRHIVVDIAKVHVNPNRNRNVLPNSNKTMQMADLFEILHNIIAVFEKHTKDNGYVNDIINLKPSNLSVMFQSMIKPVEIIKKDCGKASTFQWVLNTLGYNFPFDTTKCKVIFTTLLQILTELDKKVCTSNSYSKCDLRRNGQMDCS